VYYFYIGCSEQLPYEKSVHREVKRLSFCGADEAVDHALEVLRDRSVLVEGIRSDMVALLTLNPR